MTASLRTAPRLLLALALAATAAVVLAPGLVPDPRQRGDSFTPPGWFPAEKRPPGGEPVRWSGGLGTDYLGRPFVLVLCKGFSGTVRIALLGTAAVVAGCVMVGALHGSARSRGLEALVAAGNLGVMAVPEVAVLITLAVAWPRTAPPLWVNLSMVAVLVLFAVPTGARLIADRVRAVQRSGFVAASRAYGAGPAHVFRHEVWPHLVEDVAWVAAAVLPRFIAVEVGLAYLGVEYRDFEGLGRTLSKSFSNLNDRTASFQLLVTIAAVLWAALLPQLALRLLGLRSRRQEGRSMSHGNVLEVRRLSVRSERGQPILDEVSLELRAGEVTALVGETGSGKTTFINGILGLLPAGLRFSGGEVLLNVEGGAVDLLRLPDRRRRDYLGRQIGYVPQDVRAGLNPLMTARATVLEAVRRGGLPGPAAARADDAMRRAGLPAEFIRHDAGRRPGRLSGGQCQRVLIAQAVANEPSLLLLDEPTASLDPPTRREVRATIRALAGERRAVCLVTHDVASLPGLADTIGVMYLGRLIESGPADELLARPTHPYLRGLLGCVPRLDRRAPLHPIPGEPPGNLADVPGCPFHPRCPAREERCRVEVPLSRDVSPARKVACHVDLADGV